MPAPHSVQLPSPDENYYAQHAPFGAFASFTIGLVDGKGGFGQSLSGPANQNVYAGFRSSGQPAW
jgi:xylan 1,4-beta-xylosidase